MLRVYILLKLVVSRSVIVTPVSQSVIVTPIKSAVSKCSGWFEVFFIAVPCYYMRIQGEKIQYDRGMLMMILMIVSDCFQGGSEECMPDVDDSWH